MANAEGFYNLYCLQFKELKTINLHLLACAENIFYVPEYEHLQHLPME